jgi:TPR repeat protein
MRNAARGILFGLALSVAGTVVASDLDTANQLLNNKKYPEALQLFSKLAAAGEPEAQLRLGEMYWYGEGVALDRAKGDALFAQAAARGVPAAIAASKLSGQRAARGTDIALWTSSYDGADLKSGKFACKEPVIPALSTSNADIKAKGAEINAWIECHNGFVRNVVDATPPGKRIPADLVPLMSEAELAQSKALLAKVYASVLASAKTQADAVTMQRDAWTKATADFVAKANKNKPDRTAQNELTSETDVRNSQYRESARIASPSRH